MKATRSRHDAALGAGLATELYGCLVDAFIGHIFEKADVRPESLVVEAGIHVLGNALEHLDLAPHGVFDAPEFRAEVGLIILRQLPLDQCDGAQNLAGDGLDLHMHQDEPMLVIHVDKVLQGFDIAQPDRLIFAEALPVV